MKRWDEVEGQDVGRGREVRWNVWRVLRKFWPDDDTR